MSSFDGATFTDLYDGVDDKQEAEINERLSADGNHVYLDLGGIKTRHLSMRVYVTSASAQTALNGKLKVQGSLSWTRGTNTAILKSIGWNERVPGGSRIFGQAEFLIVA